MKPLRLAALAAVMVPLLMVGDAPGARVETSLHTSTCWNGTTYKAYPAGVPELTVAKLTIPPGGALPWHAHSMPVAAYVVSGTITVETPEGVKRSFTPGQTIAETIDTTHRGVAGSEPVVLVAFYAGVKGMPLYERK
jgi:quercetin dioxygenase-like cupin family protein